VNEDEAMYGIIANVLSDHVLRTGARVWILYANVPQPVVVGVSKGGRVVEKRTHYKRLTNYRAAWIPEHMRERVLLSWPEREEAAREAEKIAAMWRGVRFFHRDGHMLQDGVPESEAWKRSGSGE